MPEGSCSHCTRSDARALENLVGEGIGPQGKEQLEDRGRGDGGGDVGHEGDDAERLLSPHAAVEERGQDQARGELHGNGAQRIPDGDAQGIEDGAVALCGEQGERRGEPRQAQGEEEHGPCAS